MKLLTIATVLTFASLGLAQDRTTTTSTNSSSSTVAPAPAVTDSSTDTAMNPEYSSSQNYSQTTVVEEKDDKISAGGLFVEPIVGYTRDESSAKTSALPLLSDTSGNIEGGSLGLRLGVHASEAIFLAADGRYTRATLKDSSYDQAAGDMWNAGATLGAQFPIWGLRAWGTYIMGGNFDPAAGAGSLDVQFKDARGWRAGAGLHYKAVSINLEYQDVVYDTTEIQSLGNVAVGSETDLDFQNKGYTLSLSFPMEL